MAPLPLLISLYIEVLGQGSLNVSDRFRRSGPPQAAYCIAFVSGTIEPVMPFAKTHQCRGKHQEERGVEGGKNANKHLHRVFLTRLVPSLDNYIFILIHTFFPFFPSFKP